MPVAYSGHLRRRVIDAYEAHVGSMRQLAQRFKVSLSFVRNLLRHYRINGQIEAKQRGGYLQPTIQDEDLTIVKSLVEEKNDLLLKELCDAPRGLARSGSLERTYRYKREYYHNAEARYND